ncbi:unnamed protein product [Periconia digitata]|uniref:Uncharacterized protein n=1 Tax=Periconia digitata TaxID=1303443 RepID=A0A9W4UNA6_9PLEO|nr:unnamed protein product [Periconia digitata]
MRDDRTCTYQRPPDSARRTVSSQSTDAISETTSYTGIPMSQGVSSTMEHSNTTSPSVTTSLDPRFLSPITSSLQSSDLSFNLRHMQLFSHFIFETLPSLAETGSVDHNQTRTMMPMMLSQLYTLYQLLALSAMHMSYTHMEEASRHLEEARTLQTQALCAFNDAHMEVTVENCVPMLSFSTFIGLHALAEVAGNADAGAGGVLDGFVTYMNLHRGVRAIISQSWTFLNQTSVASIIECAENAINHASFSHRETAVAVAHRLHTLLDQADMSERSRQVCRVAASQLNIVYQTDSDSAAPGSGLIWVWPINLSSEFTDLLSMRKPEALIILAHYAVLLHRRRRVWLVGNVGGILIQEISKFLGTFWKTWLDWPNEIIAQHQGDTS